ncbi:MAG: TetR/AcrR family transcriptional regulator [Pseudomonadales bacterium]
MSDPRKAIALDPRIARTRNAVQLAVLGLLSEAHPFEKLTISEVASVAGITRKTFYARFGSLERVVSDIAEDMFESIADSITDELLLMPLTNTNLTTFVFRAYENQKSTLTSLLTYCPSSLFLKPCARVFAILLDRALNVNHFEQLPEVEREYLTAIVGNTVYATISVWVDRGFSDSPEQLSALLVTLLGPGLENVLKGKI